MICVLTGGTGGAKFVDGLRQVIPPEEITIIVNTGDDLLWWGLYVSPDIDSITYVLSGLLSRERGWGVKGDTFLCLQAMGQLGEPTWFHTGDRDLAVHLLRSRLLAEGKTLSEATSTICDKLGVKARILPMSDSRVETRVDTPSGELSFEEYFVQRWYQDPGKLGALRRSLRRRTRARSDRSHLSADAVFIAPSNPITSIGPILAVPGIREALLQRARQGCRRESDRRERPGRRTRGNSDDRAGTALLDRRRGQGLRGFSRSPHLRHARRPRRRSASRKTACACSARKPSCAPPRTEPRWLGPFFRSR